MIWLGIWLALNVAVVVCLAWCAAPDVRDPDDYVDIDALTERERRDLIDADIRQEEIERALEMARERDRI